jgi:hypothetical protein
VLVDAVAEVAVLVVDVVVVIIVRTAFAGGS